MTASSHSDMNELFGLRVPKKSLEAMPNLCQQERASHVPWPSGLKPQWVHLFSAASRSHFVFCFFCTRNIRKAR